MVKMTKEDYIYKSKIANFLDHHGYVVALAVAGVGALVVYFFGMGK